MPRHPLALFGLLLGCASGEARPEAPPKVLAASEKVRLAMLDPARPAALEEALVSLRAAERTWWIQANRNDPGEALQAERWLLHMLDSSPELNAPPQGALIPVSVRILTHARESEGEARESVTACLGSAGQQASELDRCTNELIDLQVRQLGWTALALRFLESEERRQATSGPELSAWLFLEPGDAPRKARTGG